MNLADHFILARQFYGKTNKAPPTTAESSSSPSLYKPQREVVYSSLAEILASATKRQMDKEFQDGTLIDPLDTRAYDPPQPGPSTVTRDKLSRQLKGLTMFTPGWSFSSAEQAFEQRTTPIKARNPQRPDNRLALDNKISMHGTLMPSLEYSMTNEVDPKHAQHSIGTLIQKGEEGTPVFVHIMQDDLAHVLNVFHFIHAAERTIILHDMTDGAKKVKRSKRTMREITGFIFSDKLDKARLAITEWTVEIPMAAGTFLLHSLPEPIVRRSFLVQYVEQRSPCKTPVHQEVLDIRRCMEEHIQEGKLMYYPSIDLSDEEATPRALKPLDKVPETENAFAGGSKKPIVNIPSIQVEDTSVSQGKKPAKFWMNPNQGENQRSSISSITSFDLTLNDVPSEDYPKTRPILPRSTSNISQIILPKSYSIIVNPWRAAFEKRIKVGQPFDKEVNNFAGRLLFDKELIENCYVEMDELTKGLNRQIHLQKKNIITTGQIRILRLDCSEENIGQEVSKIDHPHDPRFIRYRFGTFHGDTTILAIGYLVELFDWYENSRVNTINLN